MVFRRKAVVRDRSDRRRSGASNTGYPHYISLEDSMRMRLFLAMVGTLTAFFLAAPARADLIFTTIMEIQDTSSVLRDTLTAADTVSVEGVITGADQEATGFGFYIEDPTGTIYRGILVFSGGLNTFADSGLARGDRVRVEGRVTEFSGGTEIIPRSGGSFGTDLKVTKLGSEAIPGPTLVAAGEVAYNGAISEWYEGMFVKMNTDMKVIAVPPDSGLFSNSFLAVENAVPGDRVIVDMTTLADPPLPVPPVNSVITLLQGIFDQRTQYRLQVRDGNDILLPTPPDLVSAHAIDDDTIRVVFNLPMDETTAEDVGNYARGTTKFIDAAILQPNGQTVHLVCTTDPQVSPELEEIFVSGVESLGGATMLGTQSLDFIAGFTSLAAIQTAPSGEEYIGALGTDTTQFLNQVVTTRGTVTARFGSLVFIQDSAGGLRSGIKLFAPTGAMVVGDDVSLAGFPIEFFDETEFSGTIWERNHGPGTMPAPIVFGSGLSVLNTNVGPPAREDYEHVLVDLEDVAVMTDDVGFGEFLIGWIPDLTTIGTPETLHVDDRGASVHGYTPTNGDAFSHIYGPIEISFGLTKIEPRTSADFVAGSAVDAPAPALAFALRPPSPNPVSIGRGGVDISFTIPKAGAAQLRLYDIRGRLVKSLTNGAELAAGPHTLRWDGRDSGGARVGSGIYFVQLKLGNAVAATKVVVAE